MIRAAGKQLRAKDYCGDEFCGACFQPAGTTLFVNLQYRGITLAIWAAWQRGNS